MAITEVAKIAADNKADTRAQDFRFWFKLLFPLPCLLGHALITNYNIAQLVLRF
jgi:hypothetical protein